MNITKLHNHLNTLYQDIYHQPEDDGHTEWAKYVIDALCPQVNTVLDVGCGTGFCEPLFLAKSIKYTGCTIGEADLQAAGAKGRKVVACDMSDLKFPDNQFDLVFARHVLEHSPMPAVSLLEWKRVSSQYLLLVMPAPEYWTYRGKNHYHVANKDQLWQWFDVTGWQVVQERDFMTNDNTFMKFYMPEVTERGTLTYPGRPIPVEYWYLLESK